MSEIAVYSLTVFGAVFLSTTVFDDGRRMSMMAATGCFIMAGSSIFSYEIMSAVPLIIGGILLVLSPRAVDWGATEDGGRLGNKPTAVIAGVSVALVFMVALVALSGWENVPPTKTYATRPSFAEQYGYDVREIPDRSFGYDGEGVIIIQSRVSTPRHIELWHGRYDVFELVEAIAPSYDNLEVWEDLPVYSPDGWSYFVTLPENGEIIFQTDGKGWFIVARRSTPFNPSEGKEVLG